MDGFGGQACAHSLTIISGHELRDADGDVLHLAHAQRRCQFGVHLRDRCKDFRLLADQVILCPPSRQVEQGAVAAFWAWLSHTVVLETAFRRLPALGLGHGKQWLQDILYVKELYVSDADIPPHPAASLSRAYGERVLGHPPQARVMVTVYGSREKGARHRHQAQALLVRFRIAQPSDNRCPQHVRDMTTNCPARRPCLHGHTI